MKCTFACKKVSLNDSIKEYTEKKVSKLDRYFQEEPAAFVTFSVEKNHLCTVELTIRGGNTIFRAQTFGINSGAYMAELIRGGINAVDNGQMEAGRSLGMSRFQATVHVVLPQAMKNILPAIGNEMIALLKETAVAGYVAVQDLTRAGNLIRNNTYDAFNPLMVVALTYLLIVILLTWALGKFERRLAKSDKR